MQVPELTDDAVVELAREGGVAFIPKLSGQRTIALHAQRGAASARGEYSGTGYPARTATGPRRLRAAAISAIFAFR